MKRKTTKDAERRRREKRQRQREIFARRKYNKTNEFHFPDTDKIKMNTYFNFPKFIGHFVIPKAALAVYPVICSRANFDENTWIQLPQEHIAAMAGVSVATAAKGIEELVRNNYQLKEDEIRIPLLQRQKVMEGTRRFYLYKAGFVRRNMITEWKGEFFPFHTCIIDSGVWADLSPRAKALYLAMRSKAYCDPELYCQIEGIEEMIPEGGERTEFYNDIFPNREWDVCESSLAELCAMVDIERSNIAPILKQLAECGLVERVDYGPGSADTVFMVYLRPVAIGFF
jgi:hypothetical protein